MGILSTINNVFTWWNGATLNTKLFTARKGVKVGEDAEGNVYYRTANDSKRWVMFNGEAEASRVSADWHGWLHRTFDEVPSEKPLTHKDWELPHQENVTGTALAYAPAGSIRAAYAPAGSIRAAKAPAERSDYEAWSPE